MLNGTGSVFSGVTSVGVTRGGNWGCHPYFFAEKKTGDLLVITVSQFCGVTPISFPLKTWRPFCSSLSLLLISLGCHPWRVSPRTFLPVRPRLSTILCKICPQFFSFGCHPLEGVTVAVRPPPTPLVTPLLVFGNFLSKMTYCASNVTLITLLTHSLTHCVPFPLVTGFFLWELGQSLVDAPKSRCFK